MWRFAVSVASAVGHARPAYVAAALLLNLAGLLVNGERWRLVVTALGSRVTLARATLINLAGIFVRNATPTSGLGGDASRVLLLTADGVSSAKAAATLAFVRLAELPSLAIVVALSVPSAAVELRPWLPSAVWTVGVLALATAIVWIFRHALARALAPLRSALDQIVIAPSAIAASIGYAAVVQTEAIARLAVIAAAFGAALPIRGAIAVTAMAVGGGLVPTVGSLGAIEGAMAGGLMLFGVPAQTAIAITLVERAMSYGVTTALGAGALALLGGGALIKRRRVQGSGCTVQSAR